MVVKLAAVGLFFLRLVISGKEGSSNVLYILRAPIIKPLSRLIYYVKILIYDIDNWIVSHYNDIGKLFDFIRETMSFC